MIQRYNKEIVDIRKRTRVFTTMYKGARLVWQAVRSCFGAGYWVNEKAWINGENWKN